MVTVPEARERTDLPPQTEAMAAGTEKKRKHSSRCDKTTQISQIKCALEEVIANTDPKEAEAYEILGHLTAAIRLWKWPAVFCLVMNKCVRS